MHPYHHNTNSTTSRGQQVAQALTSALANPYGYTSQHAPHYAQAYSSGPSSFNEQTPMFGSSLNAAFGTGQYKQRDQATSSRGAYGFNRQQSRRGGDHHRRPQQSQTHWYEPGNHRCTYEQCAFTGAKSSVEVHMMDRHLIFPPGWDKRKRKPEWDADPSLNNG